MAIAVTFSGVIKKYPYYQHITAGLKSFLFNLSKNIAMLRQSRFTALNDVSFQIKKGETFGIVGRNGSGKSTILSLIAGVIRPDTGGIMTQGKISSLLELGAGFHPDLSGIENIILNGILIGNTRKEMLSKVDKIIEFSELGDFIYQPLRTYSSGMHIRLAFSVAVHVDPEILLVDEALAVGDMRFQEKCMKKMLEFRESGTTIVIVSHDLTSIVRLCDRALWIDNGSIVEAGLPKDVVMKYIRSLEQQEVMSPLRAVDLEDTETLSVLPEEPAPVPVTASEDFGQDDGAGSSPDEVDAGQFPPVYSWWDLPAVIQECEKLITGNQVFRFHEYLKLQFGIGDRKKGLSICTQMKGLEVNFVINNICKTFDVIDDKKAVNNIIAGDYKFPRNAFDMFVCTDLLHRIKDLDMFLDQVSQSLKENGVVIALEYTGPASYKRPKTDYLIANMLYGLLHDGADNISPDRILDYHGQPVMDKTWNDDREMQACADSESRSVNSDCVIPLLKKKFEVHAVKYFGGPLYDLLLNRVIKETGLNGEKGSLLVKKVVQCEQALIKEKILENNYAMVLARKIIKED